MKPYTETIITINIPEWDAEKTSKLRSYFKKKYSGAEIIIKTIPNLPKAKVKDVFMPNGLYSQLQHIDPQTDQVLISENIESRGMFLSATEHLSKFIINHTSQPTCETHVTAGER